ncbi:Cytochrome c oxidase assembly protein cox15 [Coemansia sp. RSA 2599]|nr:Cytochrome c oxidase assembly protein cox15 [Coemansia sp. RSA 2598]KAJ1827999.1 Cytochrome c oxidase assembly protein cox15 [Coemansia sp. RSA 2599]
MFAFSTTAAALLQRAAQRTMPSARLPSGVLGGSLSISTLQHLPGSHVRHLGTARSIAESKILLALRSPALAGRNNFLRAAAGAAIPSKAAIRGRLFSVGPFKRFSSSLSSSAAQTTGVAGSSRPGGNSGSTRRTVDAPIVGYWTLFCASMVFGIIVWGGLTRLTESGLSIVEWAPITGAKLPTSDEQWESEFEKYKQFPEYHKVHIGITLDDFKKIYFMEWFHRNIGRLFGIVYLVPAAYFVSKGMVSRSGIAKIGGLGLLLLGQGAMGWYMVASGLEKELGERPDAVPRVSQYRLTSHLSLAYLLYAGLSLYGWNVFRANRLARNKIANPEALRALMLKPSVVSFRRKITAATLLVGTTCLSGAMVAGLDAGLYYNEFPTMGEGLTPPLIDLWNKYYARGKPESDMWRNLTENPVTVQLEHRVLAMTTFFTLSALWWQGRRLPLPRAARVMLHTMYGFAWLQVALGISTLVNFVPVAYASAHQANSVLLLASALGLYHTLRPLKLLPK